MNRVEAEQLAYTKNRNDHDNNWVAVENKHQGVWEVLSIPVHFHRVMKARING